MIDGIYECETANDLLALYFEKDKSRAEKNAANKKAAKKRKTAAGKKALRKQKKKMSKSSYRPDPKRSKLAKKAAKRRGM